MKAHLVLLAMIALTIMSCYPSVDKVAPVLSFVSFSDSTMVQSNINGDSIFVTFHFEDGDGDIGLPRTKGGQDITVYDLRTGNVYDYFRTPQLPENGHTAGVSGNITIRLLSTCCIFPDDIPPCSAPAQYPSNNISLGITLQDRAGNVSDTLKTPEFMLLCK